MPMRRTDVKLTRLRIGHTRFTHRHLLLGEDAPECPSCKVSAVPIFLPDDRHIASLVGLRGPNTHWTPWWVEVRQDEILYVYLWIQCCCTRVKALFFPTNLTSIKLLPM
ncbi:hypothetical protein TNCV_4310411 [Trichonephila clavipes]|nr:hypothetical protein TNCV_4310411 [Trichonephila clavipes]